MDSGTLQATIHELDMIEQLTHKAHISCEILGPYHSSWKWICAEQSPLPIIFFLSLLLYLTCWNTPKYANHPILYVITLSNSHDNYLLAINNNIFSYFNFYLGTSGKKEMVHNFESIILVYDKNTENINIISKVI